MVYIGLVSTINGFEQTINLRIKVNKPFYIVSAHAYIGHVTHYFSIIGEMGQMDFKDRISLPGVWFPAHSNVTCTGKGVKI